MDHCTAPAEMGIPWPVGAGRIADLVEKKRKIIYCELSRIKDCMSFIIDRQTLNDLQVFGKNGRHGIDQLFRHTRTRGGTELLDHVLRYPLSDLTQINNRSFAIQYLLQEETEFPFDPAWFDTAEQYLAERDERSKLRTDGDRMARKLNQLIGADTQYNSITAGLSAIWHLLDTLTKFARSFDKPAAGILLQSEAAAISQSLADVDLQTFLTAPPSKTDYAAIAANDQLIRFGKFERVQQLLGRCYWLDLYLAAGIAARQQGLSFAIAVPDKAMGIFIKGLRHPLLPNAVGNDLHITPDKNILFLTGANMAGKSTFMKSTGLAVYLAHTGLPVPATEMRFAVSDGLLSSINLADNLEMGYSHFYAEVLRVKQVAEQLAKGKRIVVLFDELFRGTNVKDAHEATVAITEAYGRHAHCSFVISTHIIEAADALQQRCSNIRYRYLPTVMEQGIPRYTYQLREGITEDRHGLLIVQQEGIPGILEAGAPVTGIQPAGAGRASGFITDQQTLDDLNLTGKHNARSVFSTFNHTITRGGEQLLEQYFREPLTDHTLINQRSEIFTFFSEQELAFPISHELFNAMSNTLRTARTSKSSIIYRGWIRRMRYLLGMQEPFLAAMEGLSNTLKALVVLKDFLSCDWSAAVPSTVKEQTDQLLKLLRNKKLNMLNAAAATPLHWRTAVHFESLLLGEMHEGMQNLLHFLHQLDVWIAVGNTARQRGFRRAKAFPCSQQKLELKQAWHPTLNKAVPNSFYLDQQQHFIFLTGANMAGKSTIMKTLGTVFYLAHMGFPVPAQQMDFAVMEGMYTSINVSDNLGKGYSHFYAEVMRVKKVAAAVAEGKQLLVIFDELFKGTNVKDAHDATLLIIQSLMKYTGCRFVISTHITEAGHELQASKQPLQFKCMPTVMEGNTPRYTYRMTDGISTDRHGMLLINNENILELLNQNISLPEH
jgi:DNA mismatch repair ATPase MutS